MLKLQSRHKCPPAGFLYEQRQTGWRSWLADPPSQWDFRRLCMALQAHRRANPQFGFTTDMAKIETEVDHVNAKRVAAIPLSMSYVMEDGAAVADPKSQAPTLAQKVAVAVGALAKAAKGGAVLLDWEKAGGQPVAQELANKRAAICVGCPKNGSSSITDLFTVPAATMIKRQLERRASLKLSTPDDENLGTCEACLCPLRLKVFCPIQHIHEKTSADVRAELDPRCWILHEN
jgi:hypothetical protein